MAMTTQQSYNAPAAKKMKLEHEGAAPSMQPQQQQTSSTSTPVSTVPPYTTAPQWSTQIPIDPQLQQPQPTMMAYQHYTTYGSHYPQAAYAHFSQYQAASSAATPAASTVTQAAQPIARQGSQTAPPAAPTTEENVDISTLNDAIGSAGVDLRAEEETLQRSQDHHSTTAYRLHEDRSKKQPANPTFDTRILGATMRGIGTRHKISKIPEDSVTYVALALRARLQGLIKAMAAASEHRTTSQFDRAPSLYEDGTPAWSVIVRRDVKKQLEMLERIEREEEMRLRRERRERLDAAAQSAQGAGTPTADGPTVDSKCEEGAETNTPTKKPKKKKDGPGVTARNMSEDVQKRLSNAVATQAAGLGRGKYAWMNAGASAASTPAPKLKPAAPATTTTTTTTTGTGAAITAVATTATTTAAAPASMVGAAGTSSSQPVAPIQAASTTTATRTTAPAPTSSWAKPYVSSTARVASLTAPGSEDETIVTMRDAFFVIELERGHGAGRGSARGWV